MALGNALFGRLLLCRSGSRLRLGKAALEHFEQNGSALAIRAVEVGLMRELEADTVVLHPADGAFDGSAFAEMKIESLGDVRAQCRRDHRSAARQVHDLDLVILVAVADAAMLAVAGQPVLIARVLASGLLARNTDSAEALGLRLPRSLGGDEGRFARFGQLADRSGTHVHEGGLPENR